MSVKFQITLPDDLALALKRAASRQKISLAQFIRETMEGRLRRASSAHADPFPSITDLVEAEDSDLAARVDEILYR
jgi:hypothetical protein